MYSVRGSRERVEGTGVEGLADQEGENCRAKEVSSFVGASEGCVRT